MSKSIKKISIVFCLALFSLIGLSAQAQVDDGLWGNNQQSAEDLVWGGQKEVISETIGLGDSFDPRIIIANLINIAMGFLGIITLIMFMLAGFKIMLAGGNEDKVKEARGMMWGTVVGAFLILASFGIAKFFIGSFITATGG